MVDGLVGPGKLILNWQWAKLGGNLLYMAEPQKLVPDHCGNRGGGVDNGRAKNRGMV